MKKIVLEPTDENILSFIENDVLGRTRDVKDFINILESIDYNAFISIDANWGDGKTFFVRQIEMTLRYHNKKTFMKDIGDEENAFLINTSLGELELNNTYLPIYFNSWLYDDHVNALMALILVAIKQSETYVGSRLSNSVSDKICAVLDSIQFWKCNNWKVLKDAFAGKNILEETILLENTKNLVKGIFDAVLVENGQKLVVFVDELDRCKPTFAVALLESMKHFFEDDRIIFVVSLNKDQLIHTIKNYYGSGFSASNYLNRFFDLNIQLPTCDANACLQLFQLNRNMSYILTGIANDIRNNYKLSMRDTALFLGKIQQIENKGISYEPNTWTMLSVMVPIIHILDMTDVTAKKQVLNGNGIEIIESIVERSEHAKAAISRFAPTSCKQGEEFKTGWDEFSKIYEYAFVDTKNRGWYSGNIDIGRDFKQLCLRVCNVCE